MLTILNMLTHECYHNLLATILVRASLQLVTAEFFMLRNLSKSENFLAAVNVIGAFDLETLELVLKRYRYFHHFYSSAPQRTQSLK